MAKPRESLISFRQLLLVAFMLIGALLGGTALRAVVILDRLMAQSSAESTRALELTAGAQALTARTVDMERAARQSLIFNDAVLRRRFEEMSASAREALDRMGRQGLQAEYVARWNAQQESIAALMGGPTETALARERAVAAGFREFDTLNTGIAHEVQSMIETRNTELMQRLEASRARLTQQVMLAIGVGAVLAAALGIWLSRPFKRLERAIVGLGENRLEEPIDIQGPSDVRRVSQQLEWLRLRLTELDADKARFLRHVSHELKTPLAAVREGVSLLEDGVTGALNDNQKEVARILRHNTAVLQEQIEALLRFNAAAFEARQLRRRPTDLLALLQDQVEAQRLQWQARELQVRVQGQPLLLQLDPDKVGTAVANLLSNAIRFSPERGEILITLLDADGRAAVDIRDQGPGVPEADRGRIFEPFYRGAIQPENAVRGTGIGLSIVQEYIAAHGGRVALVSDSRGAHFRIELPHAS
jgi:two-component system, NtrC family, sensor histidine kinase GlrK